MATYEVALALLVDHTGALLMQHRDGNTTISPNQWGVPGGQVEPGETPLAAVRREVLEETGLVAGVLQPVWSGPRPYEEGFPHTVTVHAFCGPTDARQEDVVLGEGQAMVFVPRDEILDRDLGITVAHILPAFLTSAAYAALSRRTV
jgi:8-oxo-dGTP pyrophosphatase MutT (NUDIX family)